MTAKMAEAIARARRRVSFASDTVKSRSIGVQAEPLPHQVEQLINRLKELAEVKKMCESHAYLLKGDQEELF